MNTSPDLTLAAVKMVVSLAVVLGIVWGLYRVARKTMPSVVQGKGNGKLIQVLENQCLGVKKSIAMVQVPGAVLVLGVSADNVQLLSQLDDPEIVRQITARADQPGPAISFKNHLQRLTGSKAGRKQAVHHESAVE